MCVPVTLSKLDTENLFSFDDFLPDTDHEHSAPV